MSRPARGIFLVIMLTVLAAGVGLIAFHVVDQKTAALIQSTTAPPVSVTTPVTTPVTTTQASAALPSAIPTTTALGTSQTPVDSFATPQSPPSTPAVPSPAAQADFNRLSFHDDFTSLASIDVTATGKTGYRWYTDTPFGWKDPLPHLSLTGQGLLIRPQAGRYNNGTWSISTVSPTTGVGTGFRFGYFEARMRFDPKLALGKKGWPSFWAMSRPRVVDDSTIRYAEIDFFESTDNGTRFNASLHDWQPSGIRQFHDTMNTATHELAQRFDAHQWHVFGCLWKPGSVSWYLDNHHLLTQRYSSTGVPLPNAENHPSGTYSITDAHEQMVILGSAQGWPIEVDWVRIWQP